MKNIKDEKNISNKAGRESLTGGAAAAEALRQINPDVMPVYPITPQTTIISTFAKFEAEKVVNTEIITMESEHSVMSACIGASAAGARTVTATSSQGLSLMNEMLYIASGMRLPIMLLVSARALSAPLNIHGDHSDVMGARDTGWIQVFSENAQEVYDNTIIGMKLTEKSAVPVMVIMDGFITSHSVETLSTLSDEAVKNFVGKFQPDLSLLDVKNPITYGSLALPNTYFEFKIDQEKAMQAVVGYYRNAAYDFEKISGRFHDFFESYHAEDADHVIIVAGSTAGTIKDVVDDLRKNGKKVGLLKIKLFRPFPHEEIASIFSKAKNVAVLDRALSFGTNPPLYSEIINSMSGRNTRHDFRVASYVYGLGGRNIFQKQIESVFSDLINGDQNNKIKFII